jgi:ubiquinol oxidase
MISSRAACTPVASKRAATQLLTTFNNLRPSGTTLRSSYVAVHQLQANSTGLRHFSNNSNNSKQIKDFFPVTETEKVRRTPPSWPHPVYSYNEMEDVVVAHREAKTYSDKVALIAVKLLRWGLDKATGYKHERAVALNEKDPVAARAKYAMTEEKYMIRNVFLESVAGVPGMVRLPNHWSKHILMRLQVAGMLRHLHSMRRMKRDNGW